MMVTHKFYDYLPCAAAVIRIEVFLSEQGFSFDFDEADDICTHILVFYGGTPAATGRLFKDRDGLWHVGRIAVKKEFRGKNLGAEVMKRMEEKARELGASRLVLSAQCRVREFYEKCGYKAYGGVYFDEFCEHIGMEKVLG